MNWEEFESEYNDLASDVLRANYTTYEQKLRDFVDLVVSCDWAAKRVALLAPDFDFKSWYAAAESTQGSMIGSGTLDWARERRFRLGQQFALFHYLAEHQDAYMSFSEAFLYAGNRFDDMVAEINAQLFEPFARDLLKELAKAAPIETKSADVPASDRVVSINHNAPEYVEVEKNLHSLEHTVSASNELGAENPDERDRVIAEISATRRLLKAARARIDAVLAVIVPALKWIGGKIADTAVQIAIQAVFVALAALLGITILGL